MSQKMFSCLSDGTTALRFKKKKIGLQIKKFIFRLNKKYLMTYEMGELHRKQKNDTIQKY